MYQLESIYLSGGHWHIAAEFDTNNSVEFMMERLILVSLLLFQNSNAVVAQVTPNSHFALEVAVLKEPENESNREVLDAFRKDLKSLLQNLPPVQVVAMDTTEFAGKEEWDDDVWKSKIERNLKQVGVTLKREPSTKGPRLVAHVFRNRENNQWGASLELKEDVILNRPNAPSLNCTTYIDKTVGIATRQEAEKTLFESVGQFCWLYENYLDLDEAMQSVSP
ncbi:hypothetical protein [Bythopirellula polymerisocia]|uniref:Uncharacterized protein n=1 Tax=Bythopirellula polymerisocia TaxID=2528003 RepID=A0A5C6CPR1_9BACT|nr:hypothetical protein [Bythopirellula polymerisocia]TWU24739.1 hypothetical protein Pla144_36250 [Bythopirellula polymerisocia]